MSQGISNQSLRSKATATTRRIGVYLARLPGHNASIDVDDVSVTAIPEPSSFAMFAMGAIGLIGYRRRKRKQIG